MKDKKEAADTAEKNEADTADDIKAVEKNKNEAESNSGGEDGQADSKILAFLEAERLREKIDILSSMREDITDMQIDILAASLDLLVPDGSQTARYENLRNALLMKERYEADSRRQGSKKA